ncbi:NAD(P)-dependent oxidoreductase [Streptomyces sp. BPTC-684]|uniref:NAD-dependent epimerase/dehydratase family protein n=1 Tax=Streptomyces sp. BPTC-684 TaxID=3043734 RepID=UPI0024B119FD|nr:NAD(P)-dependent oxidoreductase [Streptomyces sp. BPTC-684]WHM36497.1 NAD(P)-dependent oxidoreductase [Streptomyces sp. BPTC-684]
MTSTAMVLGGTGFIGGHVCAAFRAAGHRVVCVSRGRARPEPGDDGVVHLHRDLDGPAGEVAALLADVAPEVVVNAAGVVWQADEDRMWSLNARFAERLAHAAAALPGPVRLVQLGSSHEYGPAAPGGSTSEDAACDPVSVYGRTKLAATEAVLRTARETGLAAVVLRVANVTGPGVPGSSLLGIVAQRLAAAAAPHGDGGPAELRLAPLRARRDFVDVRDVAAATVLAAAAPAREVTGRVINIARGEAVPVRRIVERLIALADSPVRLTEQPLPDPGRDGAGRDSRALRADLEWQRLDISRARRLLGWRPAVDLDTSLADLLADVRLPQQQERTRT